MHEIRYAVDAGVATLTIERPDKRGAMTYAMPAEFAARVAEAGADPGVAVLVVTGVPGSFCSGIDLADLSARSPEDRGRTEAGGEVPLLVGCPKPVIAAVDGMAVGMGAETGEALAGCFASADHAEGVAAFLERRRPRFTGR